MRINKLMFSIDKSSINNVCNVLKGYEHQAIVFRLKEDNRDFLIERSYDTFHILPEDPFNLNNEQLEGLFKFLSQFKNKYDFINFKKLMKNE